jgi:hypothetical protein
MAAGGGWSPQYVKPGVLRFEAVLQTAGETGEIEFEFSMEKREELPQNCQIK